jgi:hypothetical protein
MATRIKKIEKNGKITYIPQKKETIRGWIKDTFSIWFILLLFIPILGKLLLFSYLLITIYAVLAWQDFETYKSEYGDYYQFGMKCEYEDILLAQKDIDDYLKGEFKDYYEESKESRKEKTSYIKYP